MDRPTYRFILNNKNYLLLRANLGGMYGYTSITGSYTIAIYDYIVGVNTQSLSATIALPSASSVWEGKQFIIKDEGFSSTTNNIRILCQRNETIDGVTSSIISVNKASVAVYSNGINKYFVL